MTKQDKELLLKDLCARLPYGVKCERYGKAYELVEVDIKRGLVYVLRDDWYTPTSLPYSIGRDDIRPYLRPMSDMTEEEAEELDEMNICNHTIAFYNRFKEEPHFFTKYNVIGIIDTMQYIDWLIVHHFDFRNLIPMGLALPAPEGMYDFK